MGLTVDALVASVGSGGQAAQVGGGAGPDGGCAGRPRGRQWARWGGGGLAAQVGGGGCLRGDNAGGQRWLQRWLATRGRRGRRKEGYRLTLQQV